MISAIELGMYLVLRAAVTLGAPVHMLRYITNAITEVDGGAFVVDALAMDDEGQFVLTPTDFSIWYALSAVDSSDPPPLGVEPGSNVRLLRYVSGSRAGGATIVTGQLVRWWVAHTLDPLTGDFDETLTLGEVLMTMPTDDSTGTITVYALAADLRAEV